MKFARRPLKCQVLHYPSLTPSSEARKNRQIDRQTDREKDASLVRIISVCCLIYCYFVLLLLTVGVDNSTFLSAV